VRVRDDDQRDQCDAGDDDPAGEFRRFLGNQEITE
jgi:hypothetical protein